MNELIIIYQQQKNCILLKDVVPFSHAPEILEHPTKNTSGGSVLIWKTGQSKTKKLSCQRNCVTIGITRSTPPPWASTCISISTNICIIYLAIFTNIYFQLVVHGEIGCSNWKKTLAYLLGQDRSMWRTLRPSAGQAQQWVGEWVVDWVWTLLHLTFYTCSCTPN